MEKQKTTASLLAEEIAVVLKDEFVAEIKKNDTTIEINLCNGQSFLVEITEK